jgi:hypothetical protein
MPKYLISINTCPDRRDGQVSVSTPRFAKDAYAIRKAKQLTKKTPKAFWMVENITTGIANLVATSTGLKPNTEEE